MEDTENPVNDEQGGIIFHKGYLIQGENQTVEGGLTLVFPKTGKRYAVLQNTGPLKFCLGLFKDEKTFLKKDKKNVKVTEMHFTANIKIHSLEMMVGKSSKPQNIFIIVHGGMPLYFKPSNGVEMMDWVKGFQKVANAIARRTSLTPSNSNRSSSEDDPQVTNRTNKPKRPEQDSGIDITSNTPRTSAMSTDQSEKGGGGGEQEEEEEDSPVNILPEAIEMDIPEDNGEDDDDDGDASGGGGGGGRGGRSDGDDIDGPCRRSRMVLNHDRYEEQFVDAKPSIFPKTNIQKSKAIFEAISEEQEKPKVESKPEPQPRTLKSIQQIRENIVSMRLSTWPNRPGSDEKDPAKDPNYQKVLVKTERRPSEPEGVNIGLESPPQVLPKKKNSVAKWKTMDKAKDLEKKLGDKPPIGAMTKRSLRDKVRRPTRPKTGSMVVPDDDEQNDGGEEQTTSIDDPEMDPPYDRLTKFQREKHQDGKTVIDEEEQEEEFEEVKEEEGDKRSSGESLSDNDRERLYSGSSTIRRRPLPQPNQETDWKNVGNMVYEQSCRSCNVSVAKSEIKNALALLKVKEEVVIAGWKKDVSERLHGKFHVGDVILQVNDIIVEENSPEFIHALINSSAKNEIPFVIRRLPYASIRELSKTEKQSSWGLDTHKNEIRGVSGPALAAGITPRTSGVLSSKQCEWVITELAHQRIPLIKCTQDEVKQRLEDLVGEKNLVLILQPRDLVAELREGLKRIKHSLEYDA